MAGPPQDLAQLSAHVGLFTVELRNNVLDTQQHVISRKQFLAGVDERLGPLSQICRSGIGTQYFECERLQTSLSGHGGERLFLRLIREVKILQPLEGCRAANRLGQFRGQGTLALDRAKDSLFAFSEPP